MNQLGHSHILKSLKAVMENPANREQHVKTLRADIGGGAKPGILGPLLCNKFTAALVATIETGDLTEDYLIDAGLGTFKGISLIEEVLKELYSPEIADERYSALEQLFLCSISSPWVSKDCSLEMMRLIRELEPIDIIMLRAIFRFQNKDPQVEDALSKGPYKMLKLASYEDWQNSILSITMISSRVLLEYAEENLINAGLLEDEEAQPKQGPATLNEWRLSDLGLLMNQAMMDAPEFDSPNYMTPWNWD